MKKVKVIKAHRTVDGLFDDGDIFIQFFDHQYMFYPKSGAGESGCGIDIRLMDKRGGYLKYFDDIEPADISGDEYFLMRKQDIEMEIAVIDDDIIDLQQRKEKLLKSIRID